MAKLKIITVGNSVGITLPKEILEQLRVQKGDYLHVVGAANGSITLSPYDPEFAEQMEIAKDVMRRRRNVLRKLAE